MRNISDISDISDMLKNPELKELNFNERGHVYTLNGTKIPSVTTIMRPLSNEYYKEIDANILKTAANRGSIVHEAIENFINLGIEDLPHEYINYYKAFKSFWSQKKPKCIASEYRIYHKVLRYAGCADLIAEIDGQTLCIDFKTSVQIVDMLARVQLEAYERAFLSHNIPFDLKAIVHLKKDGTYDFKTYTTGDYEAWEVFGGLLSISNYLAKYR